VPATVAGTFFQIFECLQGSGSFVAVDNVGAWVDILLFYAWPLSSCSPSVIASGSEATSISNLLSVPNEVASIRRNDRKAAGL